MGHRVDHRHDILNAQCFDICCHTCHQPFYPQNTSLYLLFCIWIIINVNIRCYMAFPSSFIFFPAMSCGCTCVWYKHVWLIWGIWQCWWLSQLWSVPFWISASVWQHPRRTGFWVFFPYCAQGLTCCHGSLTCVRSYTLLWHCGRTARFMTLACIRWCKRIQALYWAKVHGYHPIWITLAITKWMYWYSQHTKVDDIIPWIITLIYRNNVNRALIHNHQQWHSPTIWHMQGTRIETLSTSGHHGCKFHPVCPIWKMLIAWE